MSEWRFWFNSQRGTLLALAIFNILVHTYWPLVGVTM